MAKSTPKQRVLRKWPTASVCWAWRCAKFGCAIHRTTGPSAWYRGRIIGRGKVPRQAWADAARRLK